MNTDSQWTRARLLAVLLLVTGVAIVALVLTASWSGLGFSPGFGWKKRTLLAVGCGFVGIGAWVYGQASAVDVWFPGQIVSRWCRWLTNSLARYRDAAVRLLQFHPREPKQPLEPVLKSGLDFGLVL